MTECDALLSLTAGGIVQQEKSLLSLKWLAFAFMVYTVFYGWVRWYGGVYGWSASLHSIAPQLHAEQIHFLYTEIALEIITASTLWGYIWKTRDRRLAALKTREELRRNMTHLVGLFIYAWAIYLGANHFIELEGFGFQHDAEIGSLQLLEFYLSYPIYIIMGFGLFLYAKTRLPYFARSLSIPYLFAIVGPFLILPNMDSDDRVFLFMDELTVAPLHFGFIIFGGLALSVLGVLMQVFASFANLIKKDLYPDL